MPKEIKVTKHIKYDDKLSIKSVVRKEEDIRVFKNSKS